MVRGIKEVVKSIREMLKRFERIVKPRKGSLRQVIKGNRTTKRSTRLSDGESKKTT